MTNFLSRVIPPLAHGQPSKCYIVGIDKSKPKKLSVIQRYYDDIGMAKKYALALSQDGYNVYFTPGSFKDASAGRTQDNAHEIKCIWADIDVGKKHNSYDTRDDALNALASFIKSTGLKPTIVVSTGMGYAAYWTFTKPIPAAIWKQVAAVFAQLCRQENFIVDPACTQDTARIMRLPGTIHQKSGNLASVLIDKGKDWIAKEFVQTMGRALKTAPDVHISPPVPSNSPIAMSAQAQDTMRQIAQQTGVGPQPLKDSAEPIARNCPQMLTMGMCSEPQWYAGMTVLKRCKDGMKWAHTLSAMDGSRYNPFDTSAKFNHAPEDKPATCKYFESINPGLCAKCKFRGRVATPVQLAGISVAEPPQQVVITPAAGSSSQVQTQAISDTLPDVPQGIDFDAPMTPVSPLVMPEKFIYPLHNISDLDFAVDGRGIIYKYTEKDKAGNVTPREDVICTTQLYYTHTVLDFDSDGAPKRVHWFVSVAPNGKREELPLNVEKYLSPQNIMRWFYQANMFPASPLVKPSLMVAFMQAYLKSVLNNNIELQTVDTFGWMEDFDDPKLGVKTDGFVIGKGVVTESGIHPIKHGEVSERIAKDELTVRGTLDNWKYVPQMYKTLKQYSAQLAICLSFAAPLMKYCSGMATNAAFSLYGKETGQGKSHVLHACAGIWGKAERMFVQRNSSTVLRMRKLATLNNIPCFLDELTDVKDEDLYSLAYSLVEGREKQKLVSSGADMVKTGSWNTVTFITANKSFKEAAAKCAGDSEATLVRVMEIKCDFKSYDNEPKVQEYIKRCIALSEQNYGLAGPEFLYQVMQHKDRLALLTRRIEAWVSKNKFSNNERYISNALALAVICGRWACEFGLLDYDMDELERWILGDFMAHNRHATQELKPEAVNILLTYIEQRQLNTLTVKSADRPANIPETISTMYNPTRDKYIISYPRNEVYLRREKDSQTIYISKSDFIRWCKANAISAMSMKDSLQNSALYDVDIVKINLTSGISWMATPTISCLRVRPKSRNSVSDTSLDYDEDKKRGRPRKKVEG